MIVKARLARRTTNDGLMEIQDYIRIGQEYRVDLSTKHVMTFEHIRTGIIHSKEMIQIYPHQPSGWLPVELLELLGAP